VGGGKKNRVQLNGATVLPGGKKGETQGAAPNNFNKKERRSTTPGYAKHRRQGREQSGSQKTLSNGGNRQKSKNQTQSQLNLLVSSRLQKGHWTAIAGGE